MRSNIGFTIVELIIIIVVIVILATLGTIGYNRITKSAVEVSMKSDLDSAASALELDRKLNNSYPSDGSSANKGMGLEASGGNIISYSVHPSGYCVSITNPRTTGTFRLLAGGRIETGTCPLPITANSAGSTTSCAIYSARAFCTGQNTYGQVGDGTTTNRSSFVAVDAAGVLAGKSVTAIAAGQYHTCALASGEVYCWGANSSGQLGDGTTTNRPTPVAVDMSGVLAGKTVSNIAVGNQHTCAIADGRAYCWGINSYGGLGDGTTTGRTTPVAVSTAGVLAGKTVTAIDGSTTHTCAIASGEAYCWGQNTTPGRLGDGTGVDSSVPVAVSTAGVLAGKTVTAISAGNNHTCVVASGQAFCWGNNSSGRLGDGTTTSRTTPVAVSTAGVLAGKTVTAITSGGNHTCAIADGRAYCWGGNFPGQLGDGTSTDRTTPVAVNAAGVLAEKTITAIRTGDGNYSCALAAGEMYCWGQNSNGQLGDGTTTNRNTPVAIAALPAV